MWIYIVMQKYPFYKIADVNLIIATKSFLGLQFSG